MKLPHPESDVFLAPMEGVNDLAFRLLCRRKGAGIAFTQMVSVNALARRNKSSIRRLDTCDEERPFRAVQLFGQLPRLFANAAQFCENMADIIDLNFGCPYPNIMQQGAGSALLARPKRIGEIVRAVCSAVELPITCKLRIGLTKNKINILETAKICEDAGAAMVTVHARTQDQLYSGKADWQWIRKVKEELSIPVAGNGDVWSVEDYARMKKETGCDYVMIGRGALGNPHIFAQVCEYQKKGTYTPLTKEMRMLDFIEYYQLAREYGTDINTVKFHAQRFTKGIPHGAQIRFALSKVKDWNTIEKIMSKIC